MILVCGSALILQIFYIISQQLSEDKEAVNEDNTTDHVEVVCEEVLKDHAQLFEGPNKDVSIVIKFIYKIEL